MSSRRRKKRKAEAAPVAVPAVALSLTLSDPLPVVEVEQLLAPVLRIVAPVRYEPRDPQQNWYVVQTKPGSETNAKRWLVSEHWGAEVYLPMVEARIAHAGRVQFVPRPFIPRYLFVRDDGRIAAGRIRCAPGVAALVSGASASTVMDKVVRLIRSRENDRGFVMMDDADPRRWPPRSGERVKITRGQFAGAYALFNTNKGEQRSELFMRFLGKLHRVTLPDTHLVIAP